MASRGHLGGLSWATPQALRVLDAAGCDVVLVETVGVGQAEVEIASLADTTVVLLAPGHGRRHPGGQGRHPRGRRRLRRQQGRPRRRRHDRPRPPRHAGARREVRAGRWRPPIVKTVASRGEGIDELVEAIDKHRAWLVESGELRRRRAARIADEIEAIALTALRERMGDLRGRRPARRPRRRRCRGRDRPVRGRRPTARRRRALDADATARPRLAVYESSPRSARDFDGF